MANDKRLVWDLPLRLFHWLLAFSILALYLTAENGGFDAMQWHTYLGFWTLGLVIFRVIWGFVGPRHARFINFVPTPGQVISYAKGLLTGGNVHTVGHNPLGSLMVIAMLVLVTVQAVTGLMATDDIYTYGPYNGAVSSSTGREMTLLHGSNFNWILGAIAIHILAVVYYRVFKRERLIEAMVTGKKAAAGVPEGEQIEGSQLFKALIVVAIAAAAVYAILYFAPPPPSYDYY